MAPRILCHTSKPFDKHAADTGKDASRSGARRPGTLPGMAPVLMLLRKRARVPSYALCDGEDATN